MLGRGAERDRVVRWLKTAASVPGFIGFAVGRTCFWQPLLDVEAKRISQEEAATHIAHHFEAWIHLFEEARSPEAPVLKKGTPDWSIWYAGHLLEQGFNTLLDATLLKSDVIYLLVLVDKQQMSEAPGAHWEKYYADFFVTRYLK